MKKEKEDMASWENSEVRFAINRYEDIFSDFDPRPVPLKGFSDDFLSEAKRACAVKEEKIDFIFMIPKEKRNIKEEARIEDRLKKYFRKHLAILEKDKKKTIKTGLSFTALGIVLMFVATYIFFKFKNESLITSFFTILLEPAGWFLFWEGLDLVIFKTKNVGPDLDFHRKMAGATIKFVSV
ncbi:MAG: hypothetical protein AABX79_00825 [Nanoarchaeota archaeon]